MSEGNSITPPPPSKPTKPAKPYPDFRLTAHPAGYSSHPGKSSWLLLPKAA